MMTRRPFAGTSRCGAASFDSCVGAACSWQADTQRHATTTATAESLLVFMYSLGLGRPPRWERVCYRHLQAWVSIIEITAGSLGGTAGLEATNTTRSGVSATPIRPRYSVAFDSTRRTRSGSWYSKTRSSLV